MSKYMDREEFEEEMLERLNMPRRLWLKDLGIDYEPIHEESLEKVSIEKLAEVMDRVEK